jgi:hypothetical protein
MNLLEIYLEELINVKDYVPEWANEFPDRTFVLVNAKWNCYGNIKTEEKLFNNSEWESIKEKGYYMV